jgi:hypothetical protein
MMESTWPAVGRTPDVSEKVAVKLVAAMTERDGTEVIYD